MNALFLGRRQHGKTTLAMHHAIKRRSEHNRGILVYDINQQVRAFPDETVSGLDELAERLEKQPGIIVYHPLESAFNPAVKSDLEYDFSEFTRMVWPLTNYVLVIDEAHWLQSANYCEPSLVGFVRMSDPHGIDLFQTAHAPADMWARARSLASDWFVFHLTREADLDAVQSQCGEEVRERVANLGPHEYLHFDMDAQVYTLHDKPHEWFIDIKTPGGVKIHA